MGILGRRTSSSIISVGRATDGALEERKDDPYAKGGTGDARKGREGSSALSGGGEGVKSSRKENL